MSLNKGKAKAKPMMKSGGSTTAAIAGTKKKPVKNRREYDEAISGDTTGNYAKYKAGGTTKKFAALAPPYDKVTFADKIAGAKKRSKKK